MRISESQMAPVAGNQNLTLTSTPVSLTVPAGANCAEIHFEAGTVRWTADGTTPSASAGMLQEAGTKYVTPFDPRKMKLVLASGTPLVSICYFAA